VLLRTFSVKLHKNRAVQRATFSLQAGNGAAMIIWLSYRPFARQTLPRPLCCKEIV